MQIDIETHVDGVPVDPALLRDISQIEYNEDGDALTSVKQAPAKNPIAWVDDLGNILPWAKDYPLHDGVQYIYTEEELAKAEVWAKKQKVAPSIKLVFPEKHVEPPPIEDLNAEAAKNRKEIARLLSKFNNP